jgi:thiol:disulfide interchange protein DsbD
MEYVKSFFGVALVIMALWFVAPLCTAPAPLHDRPRLGPVAGPRARRRRPVAGAIHRSFYGDLGEKIAKGVAVVITVLGAQIAINNMIYVPTGAWRQVETQADLEQALLAAEERHLPVVIDFGAAWCPPASRWRSSPSTTPRSSRSSPAASSSSRSTSPGDDEKFAIQKAFHSKTLPSVLIYPSDTRWTDLVATLRQGGTMPRPSVQLQEMTHAPEFKQLLATVE